MQDISSYVAEARKLKVTDAQIKATLLGSGWPAAQVDAALSGNQLLPPPPPVAHTGMWTGFLYILLFISLYVLSSGVAGIFHAGVEKFFPSTDSINWYSIFTSYSDIEDTFIRGCIAAIIVSFPIFSAIWFVLAKQIRQNPSIKNIRARKQLIYFTLVITFIILMWQIIAAINSLLNGSLTSNSFGHMVVTVGIAGTIFSYFITEVIHDGKER